MRVKLLLLIIGLAAGLSPLQAQFENDPRAKTILDKLAAQYKGYSSFKAEFKYRLRSPASGLNDVKMGELLVQGEKYRISLDKGNELILNDTKTLVRIADGEANLMDYDPDEAGSMSPTAILTMYKSGYRYMQVDDIQVGEYPCTVIDFIPDLSPAERKREPVAKIKLYIKKSDGTILRWRIYEKSGNTYEMTILKFTPNVAVWSSTFTFDKSKHPGILINDLR